MGKLLNTSVDYLWMNSLTSMTYHTDNFKPYLGIRMTMSLSWGFNSLPGDIYDTVRDGNYSTVASDKINEGYKKLNI